MLKKLLLTLAVVAAAAFSLFAAVEPSEARGGRGGGGGHHGGGVSFRSGPVFVNRSYGYAPRRIYTGPAYIASYGGGCAWLHHQAVVTGSRYWWHRYHQCIGY